MLCVLEKDVPAIPIECKEKIVAENPEGANSPESQASPQAAKQQPPVVVYNPVPTPPAPPPTGGSNALKIILIVVAVFVVLILLVVGAIGYVGWRVSRSIHVNQSTGETTITTPGGTISGGDSMHFTPSELGADIYPGAQPAKGGMRMSLPTGPVVAANYLTSDSKDQVIAFYKGKLGSDATTMDVGTGAIMTVNRGKNESVTITITQRPGESDGKTQIHIMHTSVTKSQ